MSTVNSTPSTGNMSDSVYKTNTRVTGMFSSLDTDTLVKNMTSTQQARIDAVRQKQTRQEWYNEALTSVLDDIKEFSNTYLSPLGENSMLKASSYTTYKSITASTANAAAVTASSSAELGDLTLQINRLAKNASVSSSSKISKDGTEISSSNNESLENLSLATKLEFNANGNLSFNINGKTFSFSKDTKLQTMINTINTDTTANVTMKYSRLSDTFTITSDTGGSDSKVKITNLQGNAFGTNSAFGIADASVTSTGTSVSSHGISADGTGISADDTVMLESLSFAKALKFDSNDKITFSINGAAFEFSKTTTLHDMLDTINSNTTANVTMFYKQSTDGFTIMSDSGSDGSMIIKNLTGSAFGQNGAFGIAEVTATQGSDSEAVINGITVTRSTNEYTIDGISYALKKVTQNTDEAQVTFSLERDDSATVKTVSKFLEAYNKIYVKLNTLISEDDRSAQYRPLTDAQRAEMTTEQITEWEKKAKSGLLHQNKELASLLTNLKSAFYSTLGGVGKMASEIGLTAAGYFDSNAGQISLDEYKITEALKNNPDQIIGMFINGGSSTESSEQGLIYRFKSSMTAFTSKVKNSMETSKKQIKDYGTKIGDLEDKLGRLADRYYAKFSKMETALSKLNSQSSYISQLFK